MKNIYPKTVSYKVKAKRGGKTLDDERIIDLYWQRNEQAITETDKKYGALCSSMRLSARKQSPALPMPLILRL